MTQQKQKTRAAKQVSKQSALIEVYILAFSWGILMASVAYTIVVSPSEAGRVMNGMSDLSAIWGVGLAVLGIYVYRRGDEKRVSKNEN